MKEVNFFVDDFTFSFSRLNLYETCPYAFYLQYIKELQGQPNFFSQFGTLCHSIIEDYAKDKIAIFEMVDLYKNKFNEVITEEAPPNKFKDLKQSYYEEGFRYFSEFSGWDNDYEILGVEEEFEFFVDKYKFAGIIDLILKHKKEGFLIIEDHKTKSRLDNEEKEKYMKQLYLYSIPIKDKYGEYPKYLRFNMIRYRNTITEEFNIKKLEETKQWVINQINKIKQETEWKPLSSPYFCRFVCSFRNICEYIPQEIT